MKHLLLALCLALPAFADDKKPKQPAKDKPRFEIRLDAGVKRIVPAQTIRLEFKLHGEDENETFLVLSAGGDYAISQDHSEPDFEGGIQFDGKASVNGGKIQFTYHAIQSHENQAEGERALFKLKGSACLKSGKETILGRLGGQTLSVTATLDE